MVNCLYQYQIETIRPVFYLIDYTTITDDHLTIFTQASNKVPFPYIKTVANVKSQTVMGPRGGGKQCNKFSYSDYWIFLRELISIIQC